MKENIEQLIKDCKQVVKNKEGMDDPSSRTQVDVTNAIIMRLELILMTGK